MEEVEVQNGVGSTEGWGVPRHLYTGGGGGGETDMEL